MEGRERGEKMGGRETAYRKNRGSKQEIQIEIIGRMKKEYK